MSTPLDAIRDRLKGSRIFVVPYCHPDWAWTHTRRWHEIRYVKALGEVLDILNAQDREGVPAEAPHAFRWYADTYVTEVAAFLETEPARYDELRRRVAEGRVAICGGYGNVRVNHVEGETFVRSLIYGRRKFRELFPEVELSVESDLVDVAVGYPQLPQILCLAGYGYFQFWRPHEALNAKGVPHHFVWVGIDGSRVLCSRGGYGGLNSPQFAPDGFSEHWDEVFSFWWSQVLDGELERSPEGIVWLAHGADDSRPLRTHFNTDESLDLPGLIQEWNRREDSSLRFATPTEVFRELDARREALPVIEGTLDPCDVAYNAAWFGSRGLWKLRSECARAIGTAETLSALALLTGTTDAPPAEVQETYEALWRDTILFSAHAIQWVFQDDFDELYALAERTLYEARRHQAEALRATARHIDLPSNTVTVVHNTLPHERRVVVPLRVTFAEGDQGGVPDPLRLTDASGQVLPYQILREMHHAGVRWELDTLVQLDLPAYGWNTVCWTSEQPSYTPTETQKPDTIENGTLRLHFHRGRLMKIVDLELDVEWDAPDDTPFGHLRAYEVDTTQRLHVGPIIGRLDARWDSWEIVERGPVRWAMRAEGCVGPHRAWLEARLYRGEKRVELQAQIEWAGQDGFVASHVPYPGEGDLTGDMPFCVERKDLRSEPYVGIERGRQGMFIAQSFVDWTDDERALAYVSHDGDRYYVYDQEQGTLAHILINSVRPPQDTWEQHVNRQMQGEGAHTFTFSLVPHDGDWCSAQLWRVASQLRTSPIQTWPRARGTLAAKHTQIAVSPANVTLSACYVEAGRLLIRVFENAGSPAEATIALPFHVPEVQIVDLTGEKMDAEGVSSNDSQIEVRLRAWQIVTLAVSLPSEVAGSSADIPLHGTQRTGATVAD